MRTNQLYNYFIEEKWINIDTLSISDEFYKLIKYNDNKLIEKKGSKTIKFIYVGIITFKDEVIIVLPKYFDERAISKINCIKKLIKVFKKIPKAIIKSYNSELFISNNKEDYSEISICDFIINDFISNGYYLKIDKMSKINSKSNLLDWKETINKIDPIFSNGSVIYDDCYYIHFNRNLKDFVTRIHIAVIEYSIAKYGDLLQYNLQNIGYNNAKKLIDRLGNYNIIIRELENELENVYADRDIKLIKSLLNFFKRFQSNFKIKLELYGTNNFKLIWEYICAYVFNNEYELLYSKIDKLVWRGINGKSVTNENNILKPDILRRYKNQLLILDAKYYNISLTNTKVEGNPGTYDIVKQFAYQLAFEHKGYRNIINFLLYPLEQNELIRIFGTVNLEFFQKNPIINVYISPDKIFDMYLSNKRLNDNNICELIELSKEFFRDK